MREDRAVARRRRYEASAGGSEHDTGEAIGGIVRACRLHEGSGDEFKPHVKAVLGALQDIIAKEEVMIGQAIEANPVDLLSRQRSCDSEFMPEFGAAPAAFGSAG